MSFTENPYRHMDVVVNESGLASLRCDGCGAEALGVWSLDTPISTLRARMDRHIRDSHKRLPADFEGWAE